MKYKRLIICFIVISTLLIIILPSYNIYQFLKKNKKLSIFNINKIELFNIDILEEYLNFSIYKIFNISINKKVIAGKENYLFFNENNMIDDIRGINIPSVNELNIWTDKLAKLQNYFESKNIKFMIAIAPNKQSIYNNKLPDWINSENKTMSDYIIELSENKNINILDLRNKLKDYKDESELYMPTDTHWNLKGAYIGFTTITAYLDKKFDLKLDLYDYTFSEKYRKCGDLTRVLKIEKFKPKNCENLYKTVFNSNICMGEIDEKFNLTPCIPKEIEIMNPYEQTQKYSKNLEAKNKYKILFIGDSFFTSESQFFIDNFQEILTQHHDRTYGENLNLLLAKYTPDIVIYQIVERKLYHSNSINNLPNIF